MVDWGEEDGGSEGDARGDGVDADARVQDGGGGCRPVRGCFPGDKEFAFLVHQRFSLSLCLDIYL